MGVWEEERHPLEEAVKSVRKVGVVSGPAKGRIISELVLHDKS